MTKHVTSSYVFKFVGGEPKVKRFCFYCGREKTGGMICVYPNTMKADEGDAIFVCPACAVKGCRESERAWKRLVESVRRFKQRKRRQGVG